MGGEFEARGGALHIPAEVSKRPDVHDVVHQRRRGVHHRRFAPVSRRREEWFGSRVGCYWSSRGLGVRGANAGKSINARQTLGIWRRSRVELLLFARCVIFTYRLQFNVGNTAGSVVWCLCVCICCCYCRRRRRAPESASVWSGRTLRGRQLAAPV